MAGGFAAAGPKRDYPGRVTAFVAFTCLVSATGGLIFGYDIGISGGVTSMDNFLIKFFPNVYKKMKKAHTNDYCKFDDQLLTTFTSSLYLAGLVASFFASATTRVLGRKPSILIGGAFFLTGAALNGLAVNVIMLILGRIFLGIGVGFGNQSVPVYLSEMAPARLRGGLAQCFQMFVNIGILAASLINFGTQRIEGWGWRLSLALAAVPASIMTLGSLFLPDTPNSLIERRHRNKARAMLVKIRGTEQVDEEFQDMIDASEASRKVKHPFKNILQRKYRPQLVMAIAIPFFQQLTGINVITFYAPVLFKTLGFGDNASLLSAVMTGLTLVAGTFISMMIADRVGRRFLFISGGILMVMPQVAIAAILGAEFGDSGEGKLSKGFAALVVVLICVYVVAFAWSWGPLGWLVPSEIFSLEIRSAGQSITVCVNLLFTFVVAQAFLTMLCHLKYGLFLFFAGGVIIMTAFVYWLLPETKNVPIEEMGIIWENHWFWSSFVANSSSSSEGDGPVPSMFPPKTLKGTP